MNLHSFLARHPGIPVVLAHGSSLLAGLSTQLVDAGVATQTAGTDLCLAHLARITGQQDGPVRVREVERDLPLHAAPEPEQPLATHLLLNERALPLSKPVSVCIADGHLKLRDRVDFLGEAHTLWAMPTG